MTELERWDSFCVIVGSSAGALVGLQFVVMTLLADRPTRFGEETGAAFSTPTIVHFCAVLVLCAALRAPWDAMGSAAVLWAIVGAAGILYSIVVMHRIRRQAGYAPVLEDWLFHVIAPIACYAVVVLSAGAASGYPRAALFALFAAVLGLLLTAIHNAWDSVAYLTLSHPSNRKEGDRQ